MAISPSLISGKFRFRQVSSFLTEGETSCHTAQSNLYPKRKQLWRLVCMSIKKTRPELIRRIALRHQRHFSASSRVRHSKWPNVPHVLIGPFVERACFPTFPSLPFHRKRQPLVFRKGFRYPYIFRPECRFSVPLSGSQGFLVLTSNHFYRWTNLRAMNLRSKGISVCAAKAVADAGSAATSGSMPYQSINGKF